MTRKKGGKKKGGAKSAQQLINEGFDVSKQGLAAAQRQAKQGNRGGVQKRGGYGGARGGGFNQRRGGGNASAQAAANSKLVNKAIRRACNDDDVHMVLSCTLLVSALAGQPDTAAQVLALLVKHGKMRHAPFLPHPPRKVELFITAGGKGERCPLS